MFKVKIFRRKNHRKIQTLKISISPITRSTTSSNSFLIRQTITKTQDITPNDENYSLQFYLPYEKFDYTV